MSEDALRLQTAPWSVRLGRWWFQNRSFSPLPFFLAYLLLPPAFQWNGSGYLLPIGAALLAEALRIWAVGYAGSATRTRGDNVKVLVTAGPYRHVRNPLYVANIVMYTAAGFLFGFVGLSLLCFLYTCVQYILIVGYEEEVLDRSFGAPYREYVARVPRWIPSSEPRVPASDHVFDLKKALRSERSTLVGLVVVGIIWGIKWGIGISVF